MSKMEITEWLQSYARAWQTADDELVASLFTEDARYRSTPFREPFVGHAEIRAYWRRATETQSETRVRIGRPFIDGDRVAVEWWATMVDDGDPITPPGCLILRFASDGRCLDLREYWNLEEGNRDPFPAWGE
jgi:uncharacterized protein (TIGR02246 family)